MRASQGLHIAYSLCPKGVKENRRKEKKRKYYPNITKKV
jgi:hypothetical protein